MAKTFAGMRVLRDAARQAEELVWSLPDLPINVQTQLARHVEANILMHRVQNISSFELWEHHEREGFKYLCSWGYLVHRTNELDHTAKGMDR